MSFKGALWLLGGNNGINSHNDVWKSTDGVSWTQVNANGSSVDGLNAPWDQRGGHQVVSFNNNVLWLFGGYENARDLKDDIWGSTDDGITWTLNNLQVSTPPTPTSISNDGQFVKITADGLRTHSLGISIESFVSTRNCVIGEGYKSVENGKIVCSNLSVTPTSHTHSLIKKNYPHNHNDYSLRSHTHEQVPELWETSGHTSTPTPAPTPTPTSDTLYMVGAVNDALFTLSRTTGVAMRIGSSVRFGLGWVGDKPSSLTAIDDTLYMISESGGRFATDIALFTVDKTTGIAAQVGSATNLGFPSSHSIWASLVSVGNTLYMGSHALHTVSTTTGIATRIGVRY